MSMASIIMKNLYKDELQNTKIVYKKGLIKFNKKSFKFETIIKEAYLNRISLSSSGFY